MEITHRPVKRMTNRRPLADLTNELSAAAVEPSHRKGKPPDPKPSLSSATAASRTRNPRNGGTISASASASASADPSLLKRKWPDPKTSLSSATRTSGTGSSGAENPRDEATTASTLKGKGISSNPDGNVDFVDKEEFPTVYARRTTTLRKDKGKNVEADISSCPPIRRIKNIKEKQNPEDAEVRLLTTYSAPCRRKTKRQRRHVLPQDFVEEKRSYFAEVDAFELPEEVVSESELE